MNITRSGIFETEWAATNPEWPEYSGESFVVGQRRFGGQIVPFSVVIALTACGHICIGTAYDSKCCNCCSTLAQCQICQARCEVCES